MDGASRTRLFPCLPDEVSYEILARVPRVHYFRLKMISRCWQRALSHSKLYKLRLALNLSEEWLFVLTRVEECLQWHALDPISRKWLKLPRMPHLTQHEPRKGLIDTIRGWLTGATAVDKMQLSGGSVAALNGYLYVIGGLSSSSALRCVWRYDPGLNTWSEVSPMLTGRAYSKTGVINNKLYVVGGASNVQGELSPLQSAEVFDPETGDTGHWSEVPNMPFSKAQLMCAGFLADQLKPVATGLTTYRGKLYVSQSLYSWPACVDAGGEIYDPETNTWVEMPAGMGGGWPVKQAGLALSAVIDDEVYALELSGTWDCAKIKVYDHLNECWRVVSGEIPMSGDNVVTDTESPYLLAELYGKLHVIIKDGISSFSVLQAMPGPLSSSTSVESSPSEVRWRILASKSAGAAELVACQTLVI